MKNRTAVNGAARTAKTSKLKRAIFDELDKREKLEREEVTRRQNKAVKITVTIDPFAYGEFQAAAVINECTVEEAAAMFICGGDRLHHWWDAGCPQEDFVDVGEVK